MEEDLKSKILDDKKFKATILKYFVQHRSNNDNQAKIKIESEIISSELKVELVKSVNHIKNKSEQCGEMVDNSVSIISELHQEIVIKNGRTREKFRKHHG